MNIINNNNIIIIIIIIISSSSSSSIIILYMYIIVYHRREMGREMETVAVRLPLAARKPKLVLPHCLPGLAVQRAQF